MSTSFQLLEKIKLFSLKKFLNIISKCLSKSSSKIFKSIVLEDVILYSVCDMITLYATYVKILVKYLIIKISSCHRFRFVNIQVSIMKCLFSSHGRTLQSILFKYAFNK